MRKLFRKTTLYVVRCDTNEKLQDSAPCERCLKTILDLDIKRIVYSSKNDTFITGNPKDIKINHISAGAKFLNKENSKNIVNIKLNKIK